MFQVGDKIVHPMHGAGIVDSIVQKKVNGVVREYYVLKLPVGGMLVMIPTHNCEEIGVRPVIPGEEADRVLAAIPEIQVEITQNWNQRYRENMLRIKSGDLMEVARVVKSLVQRDGSGDSPPGSARCSTRPSRFSSPRSSSLRTPATRR